MQQNPGYGPPGGGGYAQAPAPGGFGNTGGGGAYQVLTIDAGCGGTIEHSKIAELSNQMAGQGFTLIHIFMDVRSAFGPFCPKRCGVLVFRRG